MILSIQKNKWMKTTALFIAALFIWETAAWAAPAPLIEVLRPEAQGSKREVRFESLVEKIQIPSSLGSVQEVFQPPVSGLSSLVYLEDAHGEPEAQKNTQAILEHLKKEYGIQTFFLEGAWSKLEPSLLRFSNDAEENQRILSELTEKGIVGGPENFLWGQSKDALSPMVSGYGIEDLELYKKNLEQFRAVMGAKAQSDIFLNEMKAGLLTKASQVLNPELVAYFRNWSFHEEIQTDYSAHLRVLADAAKKHLALDLDDAREQYDWPMLVRFSKLKELEANKEQGTKDKEAFTGWLAKNKLEEYQSCFDLESLLFVPCSLFPESGGRDFFESFYEKAARLGFKFKDYPDLSKKWGEQILTQELDVPTLIKEIQSLENKLIEKLAQTPEEKKAVEKYREYLLLKKLLHLELSKEEWRGLTSLAVSDPYGAEINKLVRLARSFYVTAEARDQAMFNRMLEWFKKEKIEKAAIITGGFHSGGLGELFKQNNIAYVRVQPRITQIHGRENYLKLMTESSSLRAVSLAEPGMHDVFPDFYSELPIPDLIGAAAEEQPEMDERSEMRGQNLDDGRQALLKKLIERLNEQRAPLLAILNRYEQGKLSEQDKEDLKVRIKIILDVLFEYSDSGQNLSEADDVIGNAFVALQLASLGFDAAPSQQGDVVVRQTRAAYEQVDALQFILDTGNLARIKEFHKSSEGFDVSLLWAEARAKLDATIEEIEEMGIHNEATRTRLERMIAERKALTSEYDKVIKPRLEQHRDIRVGQFNLLVPGSQNDGRRQNTLERFRLIPEALQAQMKEALPHFFALQEVTRMGDGINTAQSLAEALAFEHDADFYKEHDGGSEGPFSEGLAILWHPSFNKIETFKTTLVSDGKHPKILFGVRLQSSITREDFYVFTTHLDPFSREIRKKQIQQAKEFIESKVGANAKVIFSGDFNFETEKEAESAQTILGGAYQDVYAAANPAGKGITFSKQNPLNPYGVSKRLDFIYSRGLPVKDARLSREGQPVISDHYPVFADLINQRSEIRTEVPGYLKLMLDELKIPEAAQTDWLNQRSFMEMGGGMSSAADQVRAMPGRDPRKSVYHMDVLAQGEGALQQLFQNPWPTELDGKADVIFSANALDTNIVLFYRSQWPVSKEGPMRHHEIIAQNMAKALAPHGIIMISTNNNQGAQIYKDLQKAGLHVWWGSGVFEKVFASKIPREKWEAARSEARVKQRELPQFKNLVGNGKGLGFLIFLRSWEFLYRNFKAWTLFRKKPWPIQIEGYENLWSDERFVLAGNHTGLAENLFFVTELYRLAGRMPFFIAQPEHVDAFTRKLIQMGGGLPIEKGKTVAKAKEFLSQNPGAILGVFPAGRPERVHDKMKTAVVAAKSDAEIAKDFLHWQESAVTKIATETGIAIVPFAIDSNVPRKWGLKELWQAFRLWQKNDPRQPPFYIRVRIGKPISSEDKTTEALMAEIKLAVVGELREVIDEAKFDPTLWLDGYLRQFPKDVDAQIGSKKWSDFKVVEFFHQKMLAKFNHEPGWAARFVEVTSPQKKWFKHLQADEQKLIRLYRTYLKLHRDDLTYFESLLQATMSRRHFIDLLNGVFITATASGLTRMPVVEARQQVPDSFYKGLGSLTRRIASEKSNVIRFGQGSVFEWATEHLGLNEAFERWGKQNSHLMERLWNLIATEEKQIVGNPALINARAQDVLARIFTNEDDERVQYVFENAHFSRLRDQILESSEKVIGQLNHGIEIFKSFSPEARRGLMLNLSRVSGAKDAPRHTPDSQRQRIQVRKKELHEKLKNKETRFYGLIDSAARYVFEAANPDQLVREQLEKAISQYGAEVTKLKKEIAADIKDLSDQEASLEIAQKIMAQVQPYLHAYRERTLFVGRSEMRAWDTAEAQRFYEAAVNLRKLMKKYAPYFKSPQEGANWWKNEDVANMDGGSASDDRPQLEFDASQTSNSKGDENLNRKKFQYFSHIEKSIASFLAVTQRAFHPQKSSSHWEGYEQGAKAVHPWAFQLAMQRMGRFAGIEWTKNVDALFQAYQTRSDPVSADKVIGLKLLYPSEKKYLGQLPEDLRALRGAIFTELSALQDSAMELNRTKPEQILMQAKEDLESIGSPSAKNFSDHLRVHHNKVWIHDPVNNIDFLLFHEDEFGFLKYYFYSAMAWFEKDSLSFVSELEGAFHRLRELFSVLRDHVTQARPKPVNDAQLNAALDAVVFLSTSNPTGASSDMRHLPLLFNQNPWHPAVKTFFEKTKAGTEFYTALSRLFSHYASLPKPEDGRDPVFNMTYSILIDQLGIAVEAAQYSWERSGSSRGPWAAYFEKDLRSEIDFMQGDDFLKSLNSDIRRRDNQIMLNLPGFGPQVLFDLYEDGKGRLDISVFEMYVYAWENRNLRSEAREQPQNPYLAASFRLLEEGDRRMGLFAEQTKRFKNPRNIFITNHGFKLGGEEKKFVVSRVRHFHPKDENGKDFPVRGGLRVLMPHMLGKAFDEKLSEIKFTGKDDYDLYLMNQFLENWIKEYAHAMAIQMTLKNLLWGLPRGGAKGVIFLGEWKKIDGEWKLVPTIDKKDDLTSIARLFREVSKLFLVNNVIHESVDGAAPDVNPFAGVVETDRIMEWMADSTVRVLAQSDKVEILDVESGSVDSSASAELQRRLEAIAEMDITRTPYLEAAILFLRKHPNLSWPVLGRYTGKSVLRSGSQYRKESTGEAAVVVAQEMLRHELKVADDQNPLADKTAAVQGFGAVGIYSVLRLIREGARVMFLSDHGGAIRSRNKSGFTLEEVTEMVDLVRRKQSITQFAVVKPEHAEILEKDAAGKDSEKLRDLGNAALLQSEADLLFLAALNGQIHLENADLIRAQYVIDIANGGAIPEAADRLAKRNILVAPSILASGGGTAISHQEVLQNEANYYFEMNEVRERMEAEIRDFMSAIYKIIQSERAQGRAMDLNEASYFVAREKTLAPLKRQSARSEARVFNGYEGVAEEVIQIAQKKWSRRPGSGLILGLGGPSGVGKGFSAKIISGALTRLGYDVHSLETDVFLNLDLPEVLERQHRASEGEAYETEWDFWDEERAFDTLWLVHDFLNLKYESPTHPQLLEKIKESGISGLIHEIDIIIPDAWHRTRKDGSNRYEMKLTLRRDSVVILDGKYIARFEKLFRERKQKRLTDALFVLDDDVESIREKYLHRVYEKYSRELAADPSLLEKKVNIFEGALVPSYQKYEIETRSLWDYLINVSGLYRPEVSPDYPQPVDFKRHDVIDMSGMNEGVFSDLKIFSDFVLGKYFEHYDRVRNEISREWSFAEVFGGARLPTAVQIMGEILYDLYVAARSGKPEALKLQKLFRFNTPATINFPEFKSAIGVYLEGKALPASELEKILDRKDMEKPDQIDRHLAYRLLMAPALIGYIFYLKEGLSHAEIFSYYEERILEAWNTLDQKAREELKARGLDVSADSLGEAYKKALIQNTMNLVLGNYSSVQYHDGEPVLRSEAREGKVSPEAAAAYRAVDFYKSFFEIQEWNQQYSETDDRSNLDEFYSRLADDLNQRLGEILGRNDAEKEELKLIESIKADELSLFARTQAAASKEKIAKMEKISRYDHDGFTALFYEALLIQKKKLKAEILLLRNRLQDPFHHRTKYPLIAYSIIRGYSQIAQLHRWHHALTHEVERGPRFRTLSAAGDLVFTLDYSGQPAFKIVTQDGKTQVYQIVWKYQEVQGGTARVLMPILVPLQHDALDKAHRGRLHTLESEERDFAQLVYHELALTDLSDEIAAARRRGELEQGQTEKWLAVLHDVIEGPEGKGGLKHKRVKLLDKGQPVPMPRESLSLAEGAVKRVASQDMQHLETAQIGVDHARTWIRLRLPDIRKKKKGVERKRDYLFHQIRTRDTQQALNDLSVVLAQAPQPALEEVTAARERFEELDQTYFRFVVDHSIYFHAQRHIKLLIASLRALETMLKQSRPDRAVNAQTQGIRNRAANPLERNLRQWHQPARSETRADSPWSVANEVRMAVAEANQNIFAVEFVASMSRAEFRLFFDRAFPKLVIDRQKRVRDTALLKAGLTLPINEGLIVGADLAATEGFWEAAKIIFSGQKVAILGEGKSPLENVRFFKDVSSAKQWIKAEKIVAWVSPAEALQRSELRKQVFDWVIMSEQRLAKLYSALGLEAFAQKLMISREFLRAA